MKNISSLISFIILLTGFNTIAQTIKIDGFSHPESVVYDKQNGVMYVSNMADRETGDGFISKLSKEGELMEAKWVTGLDDPKGLLVEGEKLYVTDNKFLVEMDIKSGKVINRIKVPAAVSLNDITIDESGTLYISDMAKSSIYTYDASGNVKEWLNDADLSNPNGLLSDGNKILVAAWGNDKEPGHLLQVNKNNKQIRKITSKGIGNLDGLQKINDNNFYVSDWSTGKIYRISLDGKQQEVLTSEKSSGDILFLKDKNTLILPMNRQNQVWIHQLD